MTAENPCTRGFLNRVRKFDSVSCRGFERADARIRTADPFITSEVLYQLSYVGGAGAL